MAKKKLHTFSASDMNYGHFSRCAYSPESLMRNNMRNESSSFYFGDDHDSYKV